ncbi:hypothetical protein SALBM135S_01140 [Streptomyces alboniger]
MSVTSASTVVLSGSSTVAFVPSSTRSSNCTSRSTATIRSVPVQESRFPPRAAPGAAFTSAIRRAPGATTASCCRTVPVSSRFRSSCHWRTASAVSVVYVSSAVNPV